LAELFGNNVGVFYQNCCVANFCCGTVNGSIYVQEVQYTV